MNPDDDWQPRLASAGDAGEWPGCYMTSTPGVEVLAPSLRGRGIGSRVILLTEAHERSVSLVEIDVDEGDVDARRFYERHGFAATEPGSDERALCYFRALQR